MRHGPRARCAVVLLAALAMLLTACGSGGSGGGGGAGGGPTRTVTDDLGTPVTVPVRPERVAVTHFALTMTALDLGLTPAGTATWSPGNLTPQYAQALAGVPVVTSQAGEPQLEQIAAQAPDLILATTFSDEQLIGRLRQIAPTFVVRISAGGANATSWSDRSAMVADVLGRTPENDRLAAAFAGRSQQIAREHAERIRRTPTAVVAGFQDNNVSVFSAGSGAGRILTSMGFPWSAQAEAVAGSAPSGFATVSFERVGTTLGDAQLLFLGSDLAGGLNATLTSLQQTPLYRDLPAVRAGQVGAFKPQITGYTDANALLDAVDRALRSMPA